MEGDALTELAGRRRRALDAQRAGRFDDAAAVLRHAVARAEAALGTDHVELAVTLHQLAGVHRAQRRFRAAEDDYRRAVSILVNAVDDDDTALIAVRADYADLLVELGRDQEAAALVLDRR